MDRKSLNYFSAFWPRDENESTNFTDLTGIPILFPFLTMDSNTGIKNWPESRSRLGEDPWLGIGLGLGLGCGLGLGLGLELGSGLWGMFWVSLIDRMNLPKSKKIVFNRFLLKNFVSSLIVLNAFSLKNGCL